MASSPAASSSVLQETSDNRRKSGRAIRKPEKFAQEEHLGSVVKSSAKRKRTPNGVITNALGDEADSSDEDEEEEAEESPDEEELREQRRAARNKKDASKPVAKKAKVTNGVTSPLTIRTAPSAKSRPTKAAQVQKARARKSQVNQEGLYGAVLCSSRSVLSLIGSS